LGEPRLAAAAYEKALTAEPRSLQALGHLGTLYCTYDKAMDTNKGMSDLNQALELSPGDPGLLTSLGYCYYWSGDKNTARGLWNQVLSRYPDFAPAQEALAGPKKRGQIL